MIGYVGPFTYAEIISDYTAFFLGAKSIVPETKMYVNYTGSWYDPVKEKEKAEYLIAAGCIVIGQFSDSSAISAACEKAGVSNVTYNSPVKDACPNTFLISHSINWQPYFEYMIECVKNGQDIPDDWTGDLNSGSIKLSEMGMKVAPDTADEIAIAKEGLKNGTIHVFDTARFTVRGEHITSYMADVDFDYNYENETEAVVNGIFYESKYRSAPYFDIEIDGIYMLDRHYG